MYSSGPPQAARLPPGRARIRDLFLRLLGITFLVAFLSLYSQVTVLFGTQGLLPAHQYLQAHSRPAAFLEVPTIFWIDCSDAMLRGTALAGALLSGGLIFNVAPL